MGKANELVVEEVFLAIRSPKGKGEWRLMVSQSCWYKHRRGCGMRELTSDSRPSEPLTRAD